MKRRALFCGLFAAVGRLLPAPSPPPLLMRIGPGKKVTVSFRSMDRADLVEVLSSVLTSSEKARADVSRVLSEATDLTVVLTTNSEA